MKTLLQIVIVLFISIQLHAQQKIITGTVTSATDDSPLPGLIVSIKDSTHGVATDFDGNYSISAAKGDVLLFSYIGFKLKEVIVADQTVINVALEENSASLDEVVVSAYGIERSKSSISISSASSITKESKLVGSVSGVRVEHSGATSDRSSDPTSGQLTAGEINDLEKWEDWLKSLKSADYKRIQEDWQFQLQNKIDVVVKDLKSKTLNNIKVSLYDENNQLIMSARTDFKGKVSLFKDLNTKCNSAFYTVQIANNGNVIGRKITNNNSIMEFDIDADSKISNTIDVMFTIDATGSMGDEIDYLKSELKDIIGRLDNSIDKKRVALTFYRDHGDEYVVKDFDFTANIDEAKQFLAQQSAGGGGDYEEAVEEALKASMSKSWQVDAKSKLLFLLLDAPPHYTQANVDMIKNQIKIAQEKGIKIIPIVASGADKNVEFLMRYFSVSTNGTYVFLTDDSGIGNPHIKPTTHDFKVEKLNDLIVRLIEKYSGVRS